MSLEQELRALEESLLSAQVRRSHERVEALLDDEFQEIGASGKTYGKRQVLEALAREAEGTRFELASFSAVSLGPDAALAVFEAAKIGADGARSLSRRSSVWRRRDGRWRLLFHQGTPVPR